MELFGTAGIRGPARTEVTPELALAVGRAAAADGEEFVLGRDGRETGAALAAAVEAGLESGGASVVRVGQVPTPALAAASRGRRGVMVTASHNPPADNGLKLFVDGQEYGDTAEARIENRVEDGTDPAGWHRWGGATRRDVLTDYREEVVDYAEQLGASPADLTVAVDCGNGAAGLATPQVLRALGADVVALNANVDGHFPGRESKPTPESLTDLQAFVGGDSTGDVDIDAPGADLGIAHDGDADRVVVVDGEGDIVHEDTILAVLAERYVRDSDAGDRVVVTTPNASARIDERVAAAGGRVERTRLGVLHGGIAAARQEGGNDTEVVFAAEPWKHIHTRLGGWIDGVASAAVFTRLVAAEGLAALREPITERPYRKENVECPDGRKADAMATLAESLPEQFPGADVDTEHGVRLSFPDSSWLLVRPSGTEPYIRIYAESEDVDTLLSEAVTAVGRAVE